MKKILFVEPKSTGHHMILYLKLLIDYSLTKNFEISILTRKSSTLSKSYKSIIKGNEQRIKTYFMPEYKLSNRINIISLLYNQFKVYNSMRKGFLEFKKNQMVDFIYVINFDHIDKVLSILGSPFDFINFSGMLMKINFYNSNRTSVFNKFFFNELIKIKYLKKIFVIDELFYEYSKHKIKKNNNKIEFVHDPVNISESNINVLSKKQFNINQNSFVILLYGSLTKRKGVENLLHVFNQIKNLNMILIIAGRADSETTELINKFILNYDLNDKVFFRNWFHNSDEEFSLFKIASMVWTCYKPSFNGSSGVMYISGFHKVPVIVHNKGLLHWIVSKYKNGLSTNYNNLESIEKSILKLYSNRKLCKKLGDNGSKLCGKHKPENFVTKILNTQNF